MKSDTSQKEIILQRIHQKLDYSREMKDEEIKGLIGESLAEYARESFLSLEQKESLGRELFFAIRKLDILQEILEDQEITEIMINGADSIFVEKRGTLYPWQDHFSSKEKLEDIIQQITAKCNRVVNESSPIVDARLEDGSRVNVVLAPVALNGPILTIRRFPQKPFSMEELIRIGSLNAEAAFFLKVLVQAGYNILVSGGTGSGKTTFLNALSQYIPREERIITIEDSAELQIIDTPNLVRLETRNATAEGCSGITIRDLIRTSLRMRPDRIIVGEVRGGEAVDLLQCLNTGHDGSLSTGHANSAKDMLSRLETMVLMGSELPLSAVRRQIASGVDIIIQLGRFRDKTRKVVEIAEVIGMEGEEIKLESLWKFEEESDDKESCEEDSCRKERVKGSFVVQKELYHRDKLQAAGLQNLLS
ncbi:MAG: CpaF family protein [Lachnospiraceae bacterium]|nr:CpaF family protein [Lachnospiraceae bacterium]